MFSIINGIKSIGQDLVMAGTAKLRSMAGNDIKITPGTGGITRFGDEVMSQSLTDDGDIVTKNIEANGVVYCELGAVISDGEIMALGDGTDATLQYNTAQNPDSLVIAVPATSNGLIVCQRSDIGKNYANALESDPTLTLQAGNQVIGDCLKIAHNKTDAFFQICKGGRYTNHLAPVELIDDADTGAVGSTFDLPTGSAGVGEMLVGDGEEHVKFSWDSSDVVDLIEYSANVVAANTDAKFCIFDNTGKVSVRNRLGSTKKVMIINLDYTTP
jgi:hypothetical protein